MNFTIEDKPTHNVIVVSYGLAGKIRDTTLHINYTNDNKMAILNLTIEFLNNLERVNYKR
jgi:hypothetical protein